MGIAPHELDMIIRWLQMFGKFICERAEFTGLHWAAFLILPYRL